MKTIGRYEIVGRLGRGAMSTVYKAKAPVTRRLVALKILQPRDDIFVDLVGETRLREVFVEEARVMGAISHDHVAKILDCDEHEGQPFIVLEYFAHSLGAMIGESYRVEAPSRIISAAKTRTILLQALRGLERLHFAGIIHRDIKPYNLMITNDDRIKIIDFGLSRVRGEEKMTIPGMQVGSPYYAAPEQAVRPQEADGRADLYSLGVLGYRMLTGVLYDATRDETLVPSRLNPAIGQQWDSCIMQSLARRPEDRFNSAEAMRLVVEALPQFQPAGPDSARCRPPVLPLREKGRRVMYKDIHRELDLDGLLRPRRYGCPQFAVRGPQVAVERHSGLLWQRRGAGFPLDWHQAWEYVESLNAMCWQGYDCWRMPTLEEIRAVLSPPLHGPPHSSWPLFDGTIHWLWSADHCTRKQGWCADVTEGYFLRLDKDGAAAVCAVCTAGQDL